MKRLLDQDLVGMAAWFRPALVVVNNFFQNVWQALNNGLSIQDNLRAQIVDLDYVGGTAMNITTSIREPLIGILVLQVAGNGILGAVQVIWSQIGPVVSVSQIVGLTVGENYKLKLLLL